MRTSLLLSIVVAVATGACSQSLTPNMAGAGGSTGAGAGNVGGWSNPGTGGYDGTLCNTLTANYQAAVPAAKTCEVGAPNQCHQSVPTTLSGCSCPTLVTDTTALYEIRQAWDAAGCVVPTGSCRIFCPSAANATCVSTDGGSMGVCSDVPGTGGTGALGAGGAIGDGGSSTDGGVGVCGTLVSEYAEALIDAKSCMPDAGVQCATPVLASLSPCGACTDYVTDGSVLDAIRERWNAAGCGNAKVLCPAIACLQPRAAMCASTDASGSVCTPVF